MESPLLGLILDSSVIIAAERKRQTVEELLTSIGQGVGEVEIAISAVTLAELVHGVARANTPEPIPGDPAPEHAAPPPAPVPPSADPQ